MSLVFAENFERIPLNFELVDGKGIVGKALSPLVVDTTGYPDTSVIKSWLGRNWLYSFPTNQVVASQSQTYLYINNKDDDITEANRGTPRLPSAVNANKIIVTWKASWGNNDIRTGNSCYLANFAGTEIYPNVPGSNGTAPAKGYWFCEMIFDRITKRLQFFVDGMPRQDTIITTNREDLKISLHGMRRMVSGNIVNAPTYITDVIVIYDDGIEPCRRLGDVTVTELTMALATPVHADVELVGGQSILTGAMSGTTVAAKLVGDGTNLILKPTDTQSKLGNGAIAAVVVDTVRRDWTPIPGDVDVKVQTTNGSTSIKESPSGMNSNLRAVIRVPAKPMTVAKVKTDLSVQVTTRAR